VAHPTSPPSVAPLPGPQPSHSRTSGEPRGSVPTDAGSSLGCLTRSAASKRRRSLERR
jgi:hypothetical protein